MRCLVCYDFVARTCVVTEPAANKQFEWSHAVVSVGPAERVNDLPRVGNPDRPPHGLGDPAWRRVRLIPKIRATVLSRGRGSGA